MMGINSQVKDKRVRDAAWEYIKFWGSEEATRIRCKVFVEAGLAKFIAPRYLKRYGYTQYLKQVPKGWAETLDEALRSGRPEPYGRNCENIYAEMTPPLDRAWLSDNVDLKKELDKAVAHCNEKLLGVIDPAVLAFRRRVAAIVVLVLATLFTLIFRFVIRSFSRDYESAEVGKKERVKKTSRAAWRRTLFAFLIMSPALISIAVWAYYPLARGSLMAFQDYRIVAGTKWVGLHNFSEVLFTPQVWKAFWNSFVFMLLSLGLGFFSPIILALMLHEIPRGKILYRTLYYLPAVTTGLVIMFLWKFFYSPNPVGLLNRLLAGINEVCLDRLNALLAVLHIPPVPLFETQTWLQDPKLAMLCVVLPIIWAHVGPACIIYLAALKSVPEDVYEAADLDGAGVLQKIRHITVPYLRPLIIINFVGAFIHAFRSFDFIFVMTGGGPAYATHVAGLEIWYNAFLYLKFGYAVAMAWLLGSLLVGFTVFQLRILSRLQFKTAGA
jgi:multiple sugar transport system permease protein